MAPSASVTFACSSTSSSFTSDATLSTGAPGLPIPAPSTPGLSNRIRAARRITWTPQADARLARLRGEGASLRALSRAFGLGRSAVAERATHLGLHTPIPAADRPPIARKPTPDGLDDPTRDPLPAGHPVSWGLITAGTCLEGVAYAAPKPIPNRREPPCGEGEGAL